MRNLTTISLFALILMLALPFAVREASAQESGATNALVLDMDTVMRNATAVRSLETLLREKEEAALEGFGTRETALLEEGRALQDRVDTLSEEAFEEERNDIDQRGNELARGVESHRRSLDRIFRSGLQEARDLALEISAEIADEAGADIVLSKETLFLLNDDLEITPQVLEGVNQQLAATSAEEELRVLELP